MSYTLEQIEALAADYPAQTVMLSGESITVLLYAVRFLQSKINWLDYSQDAADEITNSDWDAIERLVANLVYEVQNPVTTRFIGEVAFSATGNLPDEWLLCDGSEYLIADYPLLYDAIGWVYTTGGDEDHFRVPDLEGRSPMGVGEPTGGDYAIMPGQKYGEQNHTLSTAELPAHNHQVRNRNQVAANFHTGVAGANPSIADVAGTTNSATQNTTVNTGGGDAHNNLHPVTAGAFFIYAGQ